MNIFYKLGNKLYINITNKCSCACIFCIRKGAAGVGDADSLWLPREPCLEEIKAAFGARNLDGLAEIVFCGYGEPMERADIVLETAAYIADRCALPLRLNTNGLVRLINPAFDMKKLKVFNAVSISLNASCEREYARVTQPKWGEEAFHAMLSFAADAKKYTDVAFTVVDVLSKEELLNCELLAKNMNIPLRMRIFQ